MLDFGFRWLFEGTASSVVPLPRKIETMLWINELPLERTGLVLQRPSAWLDNVTRPLLETTRAPGMTGGRYEAIPVASTRDVTLTGVLLDVSIDVLQQQLAALNDVLSGLLELRWPHAPTCIQRGVAGPLQVEPIQPDRAFVSPDAQSWTVSVTIRCVDGAVYHRDPTRVRLSTTPVDLPLDGLPVGGEIVLDAPSSGDVDLDLLSPSGVLLERLALRSIALATGDTVTVRLDVPHLLTKRTTAPAETSVYSWRSLTASTRWWKASPRHANAARGQYVRAVLSAGAGWWTYVNGSVA